MSKFALKFKAVKKTAAAVAGFVAEAVATGVLTGTALHWAQAVLAVATVLGVYGVRNGVVAKTGQLPPGTGAGVANLKPSAERPAPPAA